MSRAEPQGPAVPPVRHHSFLAGFLSYLLPGLGQIYQGHVAKGMLFLVCLLGMFFAGQAMGDWKNVYLPDIARAGDDPIPWENWQVVPRIRILKPVANLYHRWQFAGQFWIGVAAWPAVWQYNDLPVPAKETSPFWHKFQRGPRSITDGEEELKEYLRNRDKTPDVAWVYTVIAGVLNLLVIYDAFAGAAFAHALEPKPDLQPSPGGGPS